MLALILALSTPAYGDDTFVKMSVDTIVPIVDSAPDVRLKMSIGQKLGDHIGFNADSVVSPLYAEAYAGPSLFLGNLTLNVSVGVETADVPFRCATWAYWGNDRTTIVLLAEYGGSGPWFKVLATERFGSVTVGATFQRYDGLGPRISWKSKTVELFAAPLFDPEDGSVNVLAGLNLTP